MKIMKSNKGSACLHLKFNLTTSLQLSVCLHGAAVIVFAQVSEMQRLQNIYDVFVLFLSVLCGCFPSFCFSTLFLNINVNVKTNVLEYSGCRCWSSTSV